MNEQQKEFLKFIKLLNDNNCLDYLVVIGSWAEYIYESTGILKDYHSNIRTNDLDFLIKNMRIPKEKIDLPDLLEKNGYHIQIDIMYDVTKIISNSGMEIEFLLNKVGAGQEITMKTNLGIAAQTLRHLDILKNNSCKYDVYGFQISCPIPEAYVVHKIIINNSRGKKQEKDFISIKSLWPYLDKEKVNIIAEKLPKNPHKRYITFLNEHNL